MEMEACGGQGERIARMHKEYRGIRKKGKSVTITQKSIRMHITSRALLLTDNENAKSSKT